MQMKSEAYHRTILIFLLGILLQTACIRQQPAQKTPAMGDKEREEMLLRVNKYLVQKDIELIESYAARR